jgi:hypothetical protein
MNSYILNCKNPSNFGGLMKNRLLIVYIGISLLFGIILSGCASSKYYDKSIPEEQLCTLKVTENYTVVKFDEKKVKWKYNKSSLNFSGKNGTTVKIPAGERTLIVNYHSQESTGYNSIRIRKADNIKVTCEFNAGKTYEIISLIKGDRIFLNILSEDDITPIMRLFSSQSVPMRQDI